jgi:hypothetical protein
MNMIKTWFQLLKHSTDIATGAPQVIAKRVNLMGQPWTPATLIESQQMVLEKWMAMGESWQALWRAGLIPNKGGLDPLWWSKQWARHPAKTARAVNQALAPFSKRVKANTKRLK